MMRTTLAVSAFALLAACSGESTNTVPDAIDVPAPPPAKAELLMPLPEGTSAAITGEDLGKRIATLSDDIFEGRAPASEKGEQAADWIAAEMARLGLRPGGDNGTWFQTVGMVEQSIDEARSALYFSGGSSGEAFPMVLKENAVIWTKRQNADHLAFEDSEVVFVGYGVVAPEYGWNDYAGLDVTGKTVVMLVNDPGYAREDELFKGKSMTYYGRWTYKFEEAARQGATAAIVVHETAPASYGWDVVANSWSGSQADLVRSNSGADRTMMEGWITEETARQLFAEAGLDFTDMKRVAKSSAFSAIDMGDLTASGEIYQTISTTESRNVIGVLPGKTVPDEYMLYTAHWDHLGKKTSDEAGEEDQDFYRDDVFNGAVDNATGIAAMLEISEAMVAEDLDRSVMFLAVTLEESGLLGSAYYAENPTVPMNQIVAGVNIDGMLPVGPTKDMIVVGYGASELEDRLKAYLDTQGRVIIPDQNPQAGYFYRSDHVSFAKKGVPMLYADGGIDKVDGGIAAGKAIGDAYTKSHYHKPGDEYSEDWDLSGMEADVTALYTLGRDIAKSSDWPTWYEGNEFEAIRKASLAEKD
ncbi:MAG: M28 family metallopeptidase [Henriciella sp.]|nr:M28 family metallopeptidase [Henriciella sp.]